MAKKKQKAVEADYVLFDVVYDDGFRTSNRRVPTELLGGLDGDEPARAVIEEQDREIQRMSGKSRGAIKTITRSGK
ncbi:hypothetical protein [Caenispirillum bisanense]|uniref:hypothetical protein n=1 Tax=Caenispirillum bisanense TaxID=414052 RepID=UPI0031DE949E